MTFIDQFRFWFGLLPENAKPRLVLLERHCINAIFTSGINYPILFKNNMCAMTAWWAIPYHIYLFKLFKKQEITPRLIQKASKMISAHAQRQMSFDPESKNLGYGKVSAAMDALIFDMCRLWEAVFREYYEKYRTFHNQHMKDYLKTTFTNPELELADRLWLRFETEEEVEEFKRIAEADGEEFIDYLEDFADCITKLYCYCIDKDEI